MQANSTVADSGQPFRLLAYFPNRLDATQDEAALDEFIRVISTSAGLADRSPAFEARRRMGETGLRRGKGHHWTPARTMGLDESDPAACAWALATAAGASAEEGNLGRALGYYEKLGNDYPAYPADIAWAAARMGEAAVGMSDRLKDLRPEDVQRVKDALMQPRRLVPEDKLLVSRAEYFLGWYLINVEHSYGGAAEILGQTAADCPGTEFTPLVHYQRGVALRRLARYGEAALEFKTVADNFTSSGYAAAALYNAGVCHKELGALAEARYALMTLLETKQEEDWRLMAREELEMPAPGG